VLHLEGEGKVFLSINKTLLPEVMKRDREYLGYFFFNAIALKGNYVLKVYELLKQYESL
jgi:hypothetical protein